MQKIIDRKKVKNAVELSKCDKASAVDAIIAEMLKYVEALVEWMFMIHDLVWK